MRSLRKSLTLSLTAILILVFICLLALISFSISKVAQDQLLMHLEHDGDALLAGLSIAPDGQLQLTEASVEEVYRRPYSGNYYLIHSAGNSLSSPSLAGATLTASRLPPDQRASSKTVGPDGQSLLVLSRGVSRDGQALQIVVAEDLADLDRQVREQGMFILIILLPVLIAAVLMQRYIISRELEPLTRSGEALQRLGRGEIERLDIELPSEVQPLVDEVNHLLVMVNRRLAQSRTSIGNLAHALKTPLAMLFRLADDGSLPAATRNALQEQLRSIHDRLERDLKRARLAGQHHGGSGIALRSELNDLCGVLRAIYHDKALQIETTAPEGTLPYDREDMLELIGNLADNAAKWACTRIRIDISEQGAWLAIQVADDGPGCSPADREHLVQRGLRLDEKRPGHGLGLSICHEIVDFYGGSIVFLEDAALGGLRVEIKLPSSP